MRFRFWAKREHSHPDLNPLRRYATCAGCRHLILIGHVDNKHVIVLDRSGGGTVTWTETYGKSCAPDYDTKEIGIDGETRYYKNSQRVEPVKE